MSHCVPLQSLGKDIREIMKLEEANTLTLGCLKAIPESTIINLERSPYLVNNLGISVLLSFVLEINIVKLDHKHISW